jgi:hypothetical protein
MVFVRRVTIGTKNNLSLGYFSMAFGRVVDPCLFLHSDCILVVYMDDCLLFARKSGTLDELIGSP